MNNNENISSKGKFYMHFTFFCFWLIMTIIFFLLTLVIPFASILGIISLLLTIYHRKKQKTNITEEMRQEQQKQIFNNEFVCQYISGIESIVPKTKCSLRFTIDYGVKIIDLSINKTYLINYNKITNIGIMKDSDIRDVYKSKGGALSKMAIGGLLLGNFGVILGATSANQIEKSEKIIINNYLIINYKNDDEIKIIVLKILDNEYEINKIINEIKLNKKIAVDLFEEL